MPNSLDFDGGQRMKLSLEKVWHTPVICLHVPANVAVSSTYSLICSGNKEENKLENSLERWRYALGRGGMQSS